MTVHYHGTPITPNNQLLQLAGRHFCVSFARPTQVRLCHDIGQSVMLDNGAFSLWKQGVVETDGRRDWSDYYQFCEEWLACKTTWAVIPDVIDGTVEENIKLIDQWPVSLLGRTQAAPVWHVDEPIDHLLFMLKQDKWSRICFGSSGRFANVGDGNWRRRMDHVFNKIADPSGRIPVQIHMLRGMAMVQEDYPFSSVDSTDLARNHNRGGCIKLRADRWDVIQAPIRWHGRVQRQEALDV